MCYVVPTIGAVMTTAAWSQSKNAKLGWLNLLLWGGAIFGVIDHLWNGELFLISENWRADLMLGVAITVCILVTWGIMVMINQNRPAIAGDIKA